MGKTAIGQPPLYQQTFRRRGLFLALALRLRLNAKNKPATPQKRF